MSSAPSAGLTGMTTHTPASTLTELAITMFAVADQDASRDFYTDVLGFEVRADSPFGEHGEMRWLEVAPPGSRARLALNPPMGGTPGGGGIGIESTDVRAEHARLVARGDVDVDAEPMQAPGTPLLFMLRDPDGNVVVVVEAAAG